MREERIYSLLKILPKLSNDDRCKVNTLCDLARAASSIGEADKGLAWGEEAVKLAGKLNYKLGEANSCIAIGANYWIKHDYLTEQKYLLRAVSIARMLNNKSLFSQAIRSIGDIYETLYDYPEALKYYQQALLTAKDAKNNGEIYRYMDYIANIYDIQKKYKEAFEYYQQVINFCLKNKCENIVGGLFRKMGLVFAHQGNFKQAILYEKKGLALNFGLLRNPTFNDQYKWSLRALGIVYLEKGDYGKSLYYLKKAYREFNFLSDPYSKNNAGICLNKMGESYLKLAEKMPQNSLSYHNYLTSAAEKLNESIIMLKPKDWLSLTNALQNLSKVYSLLGDNRAALKAYQEYSTYKDSLRNTEIEKKIILQEMEYENGRLKDSMASASLLQSSKFRFLLQQKELNNLKERQRYAYIVLVFLAACIMSSYFLYRKHVSNRELQNELASEKLGKELQSAEHEKEVSRATLTALVAQMNPHFLFNALNTVQSFIYRDDKRNAAGYLGKFSDLTRRILDNSGKKAISLEDEAALLRLYLDIERARFGIGFDASIEIEGSLDAEGIFFPPMLVQPYVENAIKNGLLHKHGHRELRVCISAAGPSGGIRVVVDDNGIGRERSRELNSQVRPGHSPFGSAATQRRIDLINHGLDRKIELSIIDKKNENGTPAGTTVVIIIPALKYPG